MADWGPNLCISLIYKCRQGFHQFDVNSHMKTVVLPSNAVSRNKTEPLVEQCDSLHLLYLKSVLEAHFDGNLERTQIQKTNAVLTPNKLDSTVEADIMETFTGGMLAVME